MRLCQLFFALLMVSGLSFAGCGGSGEATSIDSGELQSYVQDNAPALAAEDAAMDAEEEAEDEDDN